MEDIRFNQVFEGNERMKSLAEQATSIFNKCIAGLDAVGDSRRIGDRNSGYMPLIVECIGEWGLGKIYSLAHYSEQNGDLMADPEMTFLVGQGGLVFPLTYRNDFVGVDQVAAEPTQGQTGCRFNARLQGELCSFAADWMGNLAEQQDLDADGQLSCESRCND